MIIQSIEMNNFRQYVGKQKIEFSTDKEKNVTVLIGVNTSGKTTIIRAFAVSYTHLEPYGLRDGMIPVLLAYALRDYQNVSLYFHGNEHSYTEEELVKALSEPENYTLFICNWKEEEIAYIEGLEKLFAEYLPKGDGLNRLEELFKAINTHYASISKSARTTEVYVSDLEMCIRDRPETVDYIHSRNGVDFIPSSMVLSAVDSKLRLEMGAEGMLSRILEPLRDSYDFIIIDTCPSLGALTINALAAACLLYTSCTEI